MAHFDDDASPLWMRGIGDAIGAMITAPVTRLGAMDFPLDVGRLVVALDWPIRLSQSALAVERSE
ncbi:MAG: hypothetical protein AAGA37_12920 [Actinomycetota bacterium]